MKAHFIDLDVILRVENKVWIVDKSNPNRWIIKIQQSDFNLIKSGIFRSQGNLIKFSGKSYWLPEELMNSIKIRCKKDKVNFSNLAFSMQEFLNPEVISNLDYQINWDVLMKLKNTNDSIYIICSKNSKRNYGEIIKKIESKLQEQGIIINGWYFISETFYNRNEDEIGFKKVRLLLQHLLGLKTDDKKFIDKEITTYTNIDFYDVDEKSIESMKKANDFLHILVSNSESEIQSTISTKIKQREHLLGVIQVSENDLNKLEITKVIIHTSNLIKTFESFWCK